MRMMLKVSMPVEPGNAAVKDRLLKKVIEEATGRLKPEAAYFFAENGCRTAMRRATLCKTRSVGLQGGLKGDPPLARAGRISAGEADCGISALAAGVCCARAQGSGRGLLAQTKRR